MPPSTVIPMRLPRSPLLTQRDLDASLNGSVSEPMYLSSVSPAGVRSACGPRSARFQVSASVGSAALSTVGVTAEATLDGSSWSAIGDELVGAGISDLLDLRGYLALRLRVTTLQAGVKIDVAVLATDADVDAPGA